MELVEITQPFSKEKMFANVNTGECFWDPPSGCNVISPNANHWWELFDINTARFYYYNPASERTVWKIPYGAEIIQLAKLQMLDCPSNVSASRPEMKNVATQTSSNTLDVQNQRSTQLRQEIHSSHSEHLNSQNVTSLNGPSLDSAGSNLSKIMQLDANCSDSLLTAKENLRSEKNNISMTLVPSIGSNTYTQTAPNLTQSTKVVVANSKSIAISDSSIKLELESSGVQCDETYDTNEHRVANNSDAADIPLSSDIDTASRSTELSFKSISPSSKIQMSPIMRRAFPRTNPAYVVTGKPGTGDRKYIRKQSTDSTVRKSGSSTSLNESSNVDNINITVEKYIVDAESDGRKYSPFKERAVDCTLMDKNGNVVNVMTKKSASLSLEELDRLNNGVNSMPQPRSSFILRHTSLSNVMDISSTVSTAVDNQTSIEQSLYRRKKGRFDEHKVHRRQSSESDVVSMHSSVSYRLSAPIYGSGSQICMNPDPSITEHLNQHHIGIRRKAVSVANMLSWTKDPIRKPMFRTSDKIVKKEAVEVFKLIQTYMGDRPCKYAPSQVALDVISKGWSNIQLRDEVYMQLTRQLTENPHEASFIRGWELLAVSLTMFPPSMRFQSYLEGFITRHVDPSVLLSQKASVKRFALQCHRRFEYITTHGARRGQKPPSLDEIELALKSVYNPSMFGSTLDDIMQLQAERFSKRRLPWVQTVLSEAVLRLNGHRTEGIFRLSGDIDEVNSLKTRCEQWIEPSGCTDPHTPASLLKLWYRQLYDPLIPDNMYDECVEQCFDADSCVRLVHQLPPFNRLVFSYLIRFLQEFVAKENIVATKMDSNNIAMVWAPNCLRCQSDNPLVIIENARKEMTFLRNVIENLDTGFMKGVY